MATGISKRLPLRNRAGYRCLDRNSVARLHAADENGKLILIGILPYSFGEKAGHLIVGLAPNCTREPVLHFILAIVLSVGRWCFLLVLCRIQSVFIADADVKSPRVLRCKSCVTAFRREPPETPLGCSDKVGLC